MKFRARLGIVGSLGLLLFGCGVSNFSAAGENQAPTALASQQAGPGYEPSASTPVLASGLASDQVGRVLWYDVPSREVSLWTLDSSGQFVSNLPIARVTSTDWDLKGVADFNNDGQPDILWQNRHTRALGAWLLQGNTVAGSVAFPTPSPGWTLRALADFDGDGYSDIVWQNSSSRQVSYWKLQGATLLGAATVGVGSLNWNLVGANDFTGDGKADPIWYNTITGQMAAWQWNGTSIAGVVPLHHLPSGFSLCGFADYDGDGRRDSLIRQTTNGMVSSLLLLGQEAKGYLEIRPSTLSYCLAFPAVSAGAPPAPSELELSRSALSMPVGASKRLQVSGRQANDKLEAVPEAIWSSSNPQVASVSSQGEVQSLAAGSAVITVRVGGLSKTCNLQVVDGPIVKVEIRSRGPFSIGTSKKLEGVAFSSQGHRFTPLAGTSWTSSNPAVASVGPSGNLTPLAAGTTTITYQHNSSGQQASLVVNVPAATPNYSALKFDIETPVAPLHSTMAFGAFVQDGTNHEEISDRVRWTVSPPDSLLVLQEPRQDGKIQFFGLKPGTANVTAIDPVSGLQSSVTVEVDPQAPGTPRQVGHLTIDDGVRSTVLSPDGRKLYLHRGNNSVVQVDVQTHLVERTISFPAGTVVSHLRLSPSGNTLALSAINALWTANTITGNATVIPLPANKTIFRPELITDSRAVGIYGDNSGQFVGENLTMADLDLSTQALQFLPVRPYTHSRYDAPTQSLILNQLGELFRLTAPASGSISADWTETAPPFGSWYRVENACLNPGVGFACYFSSSQPGVPTASIIYRSFDGPTGVLGTFNPAHPLGLPLNVQHSYPISQCLAFSADGQFFYRSDPRHLASNDVHNRIWAYRVDQSTKISDFLLPDFDGSVSPAVPMLAGLHKSGLRKTTIVRVAPSTQDADVLLGPNQIIFYE